MVRRQLDPLVVAFPLASCAIPLPREQLVSNIDKAHPFIMKDARVITEVLNYLSTGLFKSANAAYFDCAAVSSTSTKALNEEK